MWQKYKEFIFSFNPIEKCLIYLLVSVVTSLFIVIVDFATSDLPSSLFPVYVEYLNIAVVTAITVSLFVAYWVAELLVRLSVIECQVDCLSNIMLADSEEIKKEEKQNDSTKNF